MPAHQATLEYLCKAPVRRGRTVPRSGRIVRRTGLVVLGTVPAVLAWQPGRIHQLARMRLIDLIALYQSMLPGKTGEHDHAARTAVGGWTKDQVITAIRDLEAPYEAVGGWKRAMEIIGAEAADGDAGR